MSDTVPNSVETKAITKMMESLPPGTIIPRYIMVGEDAFHAGTIEYHQKRNREILAENDSITKKFTSQETQIATLNTALRDIAHMSLWKRLQFLLFRSLPRKATS